MSSPSRVLAVAACLSFLWVASAVFPQERRKTVYDLSRDLASWPRVVVFGPEGGRTLARAPDGLQLQLAFGRKDPGHVGVEIPSAIQGDFDISAGYDLRKIGEPVSEYGAGVALRVFFDTPDSAFAVLSRTRKAKGEFVSGFWVAKNAMGKDHYTYLGEKQAVSAKGRLRVSRADATISYWIQDGRGEFLPIATTEKGGEPVSKVRYYVATNTRPTEMDVLLTDVAIETARAPAMLQEENVEPPAAAWTDRFRLVGAALFLLITAVAVGVAVWSSRRRSAPASVPSPARLETSRPTACPKCGKPLSLKAEVAGQSVKCPYCGMALSVPLSKKASS